MQVAPTQGSMTTANFVVDAPACRYPLYDRMAATRCLAGSWTVSVGGRDEATLPTMLYRHDGMRRLVVLLSHRAAVINWGALLHAGSNHLLLSIRLAGMLTADG